MTVHAHQALIGMAPPQGGGGQTGNPLMSLLPLIIMFVIFYFLLIRPQVKKQKEHQALLNALKKGDEVVTSGGIYGKITALDESTVHLQIAENVRVKIDRSAIQGLAPKPADAKEG